MVRKFFSFVFAFLLLGLQQELLLHPLTHLPELKARHHSSLKLPAIDIACVECSLLASATHAAPARRRRRPATPSRPSALHSSPQRDTSPPLPTTRAAPRLSPSRSLFGAPRFVRGAGSSD